ncbi:hypothetical protein [Flavobacterium sp. FlaQc-30]|uniref:hypothetical protein n=1 Tax=Flavobacterium sp. FlaQc-30 TaxID=3374179 RepID=UPI0037582592
MNKYLLIKHIAVRVVVILIAYAFLLYKMMSNNRDGGSNFVPDNFVPMMIGLGGLLAWSIWLVAETVVYAIQKSKMAFVDFILLIVLVGIPLAVSYLMHKYY